MRSSVLVRTLPAILPLGMSIVGGCAVPGGNANVNGSGNVNDNDTDAGPVDAWAPPRTAAEWQATPVRGAVIEMGYGGPDEFNDPPYPSAANLLKLHGLGARVVALEFQYAWTIEPPYEPDESQFSRIAAALDNIADAGLYTVLCVRNGPGRNAMMPAIPDDDVITTLYVEESARGAYMEMLRDVVARFKERADVIAWEPIVEPVLDQFLTREEAPFPEASGIWHEIASEMIEAIREEDPDRPILVEPVNWGGPDGFTLFRPFDDDNIIYCVHTYEPHSYTHQFDPPYTAYPGVFDGEHADKGALSVLLAPVDDFQARYEVPIVVGEWGGVRWLPGMEQYIADQLSLFEDRSWSWLWYAWDDEEWDELGFQLHLGPDRESPDYDPQAPAFQPIVDAWRAAISDDDGDGQGGGLSDGPPTSPRADGATLLFSAYTADNPNASSQNPAFSPEGSRIVFTRFANGYNTGPAELWIVNVDGTGAHRITPVEDQDNVNVPGSAWSAANDEIVFASDRDEADDIWTIRPDGSGLRRITTHTPPPYWIEPVWSPDGVWIVFEADTEAPTELEQRGTIFKVRSDGTELTQLTKRNGEDFDDRLPNWSSGGDRILFQRRVPSQGDGDTWDIYTIDTDGDYLINISNGPEFFNTDNSWSSDGRWIASSSEYPVDGDQLSLPNIVGFFVPDPDSGEEVRQPVRITYSDGHEDGAPSVSPDGQWTAFESHRTQDEQSPADLWIIRTPEPLLPHTMPIW